MIKKKPKCLIMSTFPEVKCGVATYANDQVTYYQKKGYRVYRFSIVSDTMSAAHFRIKLSNVSNLIKSILLLCFQRYQIVSLHFTNALIFQGPSAGLKGKIRRFTQHIWLMFLGLRFGDKFTLICHEMETKSSQTWWSRFLKSIFFAPIKNIEVHTLVDKKAISKFLPLVSNDNIKIIPHEKYLQYHYKCEKYQARSILNLPQDDLLVLCIGFVKTHKGFDDVVRAMPDVSNRKKIKLYIVGEYDQSPESSQKDYIESLKELIKSTKRVEWRAQYLDNREFDIWLCACDILVLPYRQIWSSGVAARAGLHNVPIVSREIPESRVIGVETAPLSFLASWLRINGQGRANARVLYQSMWQADVSDADIVYAFLSPAPMAKLYEKLKTEMKPGSLFISNSFAVPEREPDEVISVDDARQTQLLVWRM